MQERDAAYQQLIQTNDYVVETRVGIQTNDGFQYFDEDQLVSVDLKNRAFSQDEMCIGGALEGSCTVVLRCPPGYTATQLSGTIPKAAMIMVFQRLAGTVETEESRKHSAVVGVAVVRKAVVGRIHGDLEPLESGWLTQGVYNVDTRDASIDYQLTLNGLDRMAWAEAEWVSSATAAYDNEIVREIASAMHVPVDEATWTAMGDRAYVVQYATGYTMREVLGYIAAMHCGNFVFTKEGDLLLLQLNRLPEETNYILNEIGDYITMGGARIDVHTG